MYSTKKTMAPTTMKCRLPNMYELFLSIGFSCSGCYSSQQFSQNNILMTTIKLKTFQDYFVKFKHFRAFQDFQGPVRTLLIAMQEREYCVVYNTPKKDHHRRNKFYMIKNMATVIITTFYSLLHGCCELDKRLCRKNIIL